MWKATLKGILARRVRLALTALAVLLGVSFVSGTYVLTDTLDRSFAGVFEASLTDVDLVVRRTDSFADPGGGRGERGSRGGSDPFPEAVLTQVEQVPGVASVHGWIQEEVGLVDPAGEAISTGGAPGLGLAWDQDDDQGPFRVVHDDGRRSRAPRRAGEVAIDAGTAREHGFRVGDPIDVVIDGPKQQFRIVGLFSLGGQTDLGSITAAAFDLESAQELLGRPDQLEAVNVIAAPGVSSPALAERVAGVLGPSYAVEPASAVAADRGDNILRILDVLTQLLLGFASIGLVVGAFIIFNTFTILVTQRTREFGLLRAMGATPRQVVVSVLLEAVVIGAIASALGLAAGIVLGSGLLRVVNDVGFDLPAVTTVVQERTIIAAFVVGMVVTVVASVWPAVRAARVPPVAAINDLGPARTRSFGPRAAVGAAIVAAGIPILVIGLDRARSSSEVLGEMKWVALGVLVVFFGVITLIATFARPLAGLLGRPLRVIGVSGTLARANAMRNPRRTAATASALVIGLTLVSLVAIFGSSSKASVRQAVSQSIRADLVITTDDFSEFSEEIPERLRGLPEVEAVVAFKFDRVRVGMNGPEATLAGVDPEGLASVVALDLAAGSSALDDDGVLVSGAAAEEHGLSIGDQVVIEARDGVLSPTVTGITHRDDFTGGFPISFLVTRSTFTTRVDNDDQLSLVYITATGRADAARHSVDAALGGDFPNVAVLTLGEYQEDQEQSIDRVLAGMAALLLLSEIIAVLGIVNTLALSVFERTRELGLLRVVGMTRRQVRRMVRGESVIIALIGGVVGIALGVFWGWAFVSALQGQGITQFHVPPVQLAAFVAVSVLAGLAAALVPAWRASRLDVLDAIATE